MIIFLIILYFLIGSLMFSYWIGRLFGYDIREYGDGNPGATNAFKAAGIKAGFPSLLLDFLKGAIPLFIAFWILQINDWRLIPLSIAPILGHSFSPFLKFKGGKAIAVTFGVWSGITLWEIPVVLGLSLSFFTFILIFKEDGWKVLIGMIFMLIYIIVFKNIVIYTIIASLNLLIVSFNHRSELFKIPTVKLPITYKKIK